ncbi:MAG: tRNA pseudouridine(55) synthase TruB [Ruminococcus sp.]|nr:tRNA pseudouridine(55) synthase TruB [Ruminococcus sp.]
MNGILCMNKPQEFTSFDVIGKLRGILHIKRLGHTGTLDPMATGVLPVLVGTAAKACDIMPCQDKIYRAGVRFGCTSDTLDIWGNEFCEYPDMYVTEQALREIIPAFTGEIEQLPPMYSAVSVGGKRLYELARKGIETERPVRKARVYSIELESFCEEKQEASLLVSCGKGTYIRTLLDDMGKALGGGAVMTSLCRTMASGFDISECYTFEEVKWAVDNGSIENLLIPTERLFDAYPKLHLNDVQTRMYRNGVKLDLGRIHNIIPDKSDYTVYSCDGAFIGTAKADFEHSELRCGKNFEER